MRSDVSTPGDLPVMVGVNGSRNSPALVALAAGEAALRRAPLVIVHVWPGRYTGAFRGRGTVPSRADAQRLLELMAGRARLTAPEVPVRTELLDGGAANLLTEASGSARLLVLGHRDEAYTRPAWGSTTAYLSYHSACPLLVYRGATPSDGPIVVATSTRPEGDATLRYAFERAALVGAPVVAMHMWTRPGAADGTPPAVRPGAYAEERAVAEQALAKALTRWTGQFPGVPVEPLVVNDFEVAYTVERALQRGRLLVAGIGRTGSFAELLCSAREASTGSRRTCPTVLIPTSPSTCSNVAVTASLGAGDFRPPGAGPTTRVLRR